MFKIPSVSYSRKSLGNYFRYVSNLGATFLSQSVSAISILLLTPVLVEKLGKENFGLYGVLLNIVVFSSIFDFGLIIGLLRRLIHNKKESLALINSLFFFFFISLCIKYACFFSFSIIREFSTPGTIFFIARFLRRY